MSDTRNVIMSDVRNEKFWHFACLGTIKIDNKKHELNYTKFDVQLVAKKTGTVRIKLTHFYNFFLMWNLFTTDRLELMSKFNDIFKYYWQALTKPNLHYENFPFPFFSQPTVLSIRFDCDSNEKKS
jgi:hypothetical protein